MTFKSLVNKSVDFHLFYGLDGRPKMSVTVDGKKTKAIEINRSLASMLIDRARYIIETTE